MNECRCGKPTRDAAYFCEDCGDQLAQALGECPWVDTELTVTLTGTRGIDYSRGGTRTTEHRLPVNLGASQAATHLRATLVSWVKFCHDEHIRHQSPTPGLPADTVPAMSRWLMWRVDGLALHDIGPDAVDEITAAVARGKRIVDRPADRWYAGPCDCGEDLYARMQKGTVKCRVTDCALEYDVAERREWLMDAARDELADVATISRAVSWLGGQPVNGKRIQKWAERDRIKSRGTRVDSTGRPRKLYLIGDVLEQLARDAEKTSRVSS